MPDIDYSLYLATDRGLLAGHELPELVATAIENGVTIVQLREKNCSAREFFEIGRAVHVVTRRYGIPLIVNDRVDVMLALDAEGVHVGRDDLPLVQVRAIAKGRIVGYSVNTLTHLRLAEQARADYVGVGPAFATGTKSDTGPVLGVEGVRQIAAVSSLPCVAIGGITPERAAELKNTGIAGVCVVSGICGASDPGGAARAYANALHRSV